MAFAEAVKAKFSPPPLSSSQGHPAWGHGYGGGLLDTRGGGLLPANAVARGHRGRPHGSVLQLAVGCGVALFLVFTVYKVSVCLQNSWFIRRSAQTNRGGGGTTRGSRIRPRARSRVAYARCDAAEVLRYNVVFFTPPG